MKYSLCQATPPSKKTSLQQFLSFQLLKILEQPQSLAFPFGEAQELSSFSLKQDNLEV